MKSAYLTQFQKFKMLLLISITFLLTSAITSAQEIQQELNKEKIIDVSIGYVFIDNGEVLLNVEYDNTGGNRRINPFVGFERSSETVCTQLEIAPMQFPVCIEEQNFGYFDVYAGLSFYSKRKEKSLNDNGFNLQTGLSYRITQKPDFLFATWFVNYGYRFFVLDNLYIYGSLNWDTGFSMDSDLYTFPNFDLGLSVKIGYQF